MKTKFRVCNLRFEDSPSHPYQFPSRDESARIIRAARINGANSRRVKTLGTFPGQPDSVRIYLTKDGVNTIVELSSY